MRSENIAWERLIRHPLAMYERTSLITTIFLDRNQIEMVEHLSGDDAQTFVDTVDMVRLCTLSQRMGGSTPTETSSFVD